MTLVLDDRAFTATRGTYALCLHHAENALCSVCYYARTVACGTCLRAASGLSTAAMTVRACDVLAHLELFGHAVCDFAHRQFHFQSQVAASVLLRPALASSETSEATGTSAEDVTEHGENVVHVHAAAKTTSESSGTCWAVESELIILLALLGVMQYVVSLGCFLKLLFGFPVARIAVGVILDGDFAVCLLYFVF